MDANVRYSIHLMEPMSKLRDGNDPGDGTSNTIFCSSSRISLLLTFQHHISSISQSQASQERLT